MDNLSVHLLRGREAILENKSILDELAHMSDQPGASDDLAYHLSNPDALRKIPCLVLIPNASISADKKQSVRGFSGAVLLFEYKVLGMSSKVYASADTTGRRVVFAPAIHRARAAAYACQCLIAKGAEIAMTSIYEPGAELFARSEVSRQLEADSGCGGRSRGMWSLVARDNPLYLPLCETLDETLSFIGKRTRANLRYYRRKAEKELSCTFIPDAVIGMDEFVSFNRESAYPVSDELARWRYESLAKIERPFLHGVRDGANRWLSLVSGRLTGDQVVLEWQCNRADLPAASLSTVMRSYLIEHEGRRGMKRLYIEGGTPSSLRRSFVVEGAADLTLCRRPAWMIRKLAGRIFPSKNYLARILTDDTLVWNKY